MAIKFRCPTCAKTLSVADHLAGKRGRCPSCRLLVEIPQQTELPPPEKEEEPQQSPPEQSTPPPPPAAPSTHSPAPSETQHRVTYVRQQEPSNTLGTAGFITSLVGFLTCGVLSPLGLLFSLFAVFNRPRGMAVAGLVIGALGSLWLVFVGFALLVAVLGVSAGVESAAAHLAADAQIGLLEGALEHYQLDMGDFPEGLEQLYAQPNAHPSWQGPYLQEEALLDPWNQPFRYAWPSDRLDHKPAIWSLGPDGQDGTEDDVTNW